MIKGSPKDLNKIIKQAEEQGWTINISNGGHLKWVSAMGSVFFSSRTPSDRRALHKIKRDLRLRGFIEIRKKG